MKKMKKLFAILMTMAMVMGLSITGFAAPNPGSDEVYGTSDDTGTITVNGITAEEEISVTAYPIIKANYDNDNGNFTGYTSLYPNIITTTMMEDPENNINQATLNSIIANLNSELGSYSMDLNEDGTSYSGTVPVGSYLVMITGAETKVYNPVVVSVEYKNENGGNALDEGTVSIIDEGNAWTKVTDVPTIDKTVSDADETNVNGNSVNIGDTVTYDVTIDPIPNYGGNHPVLNVVDKLSAGLTFNNNSDNSVTVTVYENEEDEDGTLLVRNTDYTWTYEDIDEDGSPELKVDFVVNNAYKLNQYEGQKVVITYSATVNGNAAVNENDNSNDVTLNYTTDSKTTGHDGSDDDKTYTYTFDINGTVDGTQKVLTKTGETENGETKPLDGAIFTLYTDIKCENEDIYTNSIFNGTATSDINGQLEIKGLAEGTYYLKETTAPAGYSLNTHVYTVNIDATYNNVTGILTSWTITIDGNKSTFTVNHESDNVTVEDSVTPTEIKNTSLVALPSTGGMGTTLFTIAGCVIMISAAGLFFATRKRAN